MSGQLKQAIRDAGNQSPLLRQAWERYSGKRRRGTIASGVGKGLTFDCTHGTFEYLAGTADIPEQEFLSQHLHAGSVFYDIGANIGFFACIGARLVGETGHVYAFEPSPDSANLLRNNIRLNDLNNVEVVQCAASNYTGTTMFDVSGYASVARIDQSGKGAKTVEVPVSTIDDLVGKSGMRRPDVVMIDVEGVELDVLRGMERIVRDYRPIILCEVHWLGDAFRLACSEIFEPLGYCLRTLSGDPFPLELVRYHALMIPADLPHTPTNRSDEVSTEH